MANTLNATKGSKDANSYISVADAELYFANSLNAGAWADASDDTKAKALVSSTRLIDAKYEWLGIKSNFRYNGTVQLSDEELDPGDEEVDATDAVDDGEDTTEPGQGEQALAWPRWSVSNLDGYIYNSDELPPRLLDATCELALKLLSGTDATFGDAATAGIKRVSAGSVSVEFDKDDRPETIPDAVSDLLRHLVASDRDATFRQIDLLRT